MADRNGRLARRVHEIGLSPTLEVADLARKLRSEGRDVLDFSAGQPDFPTPDPVKAAGKAAIDDNQTGYTATAGVLELRRGIADLLARERDVHYAPEQIVVSPGAKASLYFACLALAGPGDEIVVPSPYWTSYPEQVRLAGAEPVFVECVEENGFKLTAERLAEVVGPKTRALLLNYPSNPTGACYAPEELEPLARLCVDRGIWIIADEIYSRLVYDGRRFTSVAALSPEIRDHTVLIDGMSKTYSMTGWRIGFAAGSPDVISAMVRLQSHSTSNATSISQWASLRALELTADDLAPRVAEFDRRRREMVARLTGLPGVRCSMPQGAFYVFPNVSGCFNERVACGKDLARHLLEHSEVAVVPGEAFGSDRHIRLSYAVSLDRVRQGMDRIEAALKAL